MILFAQVLELLLHALRDSALLRTDNTTFLLDYINNGAISLVMQSEPGIPNVPDSVKVKMVQLLLDGKRLGPPVRHYGALRLADLKAHKPVFEMLLCDKSARMALFFPQYYQVQTTKGNRGKMLLEYFKHIYKTTVLCFNRAWQRGMKVPNDVVRLALSEWCCI
jgi:hypothetical protein